MFVIYKGKHVTRSSTVGIWSTSISCSGPQIFRGRQSAVGQVSRQSALDMYSLFAVRKLALLVMCLQQHRKVLCSS